MPKHRVYNKRPRSYYGGRIKSDAFYRKAAIALRKMPSMLPELKFNDEEVDAKAFSTSWITMMPADNTISGVAQSITDEGRDGRCYYIHSIHMRWYAEAAVVEDGPDPFNDLLGRIMVVLDTQANGTAVTPTDVMEGGFIEDYLAYRNLNHVKRFRVLYDKTFRMTRIGQTAVHNVVLDSTTYSTPTTRTPVYHFNKRFAKPIKVVTEGTDGTIASISDNAIVVIGTANTAGMFLQYHSRLRFTG